MPVYLFILSPHLTVISSYRNHRAHLKTQANTGQHKQGLWQNVLHKSSPFPFPVSSSSGPTLHDFYSATATPIDSLLGTHRVKGSVLPTACLSRLTSLSMATPWSLHFATKTMICGSADLYFFCVFPCIKHCRMQTWNSIASEIELSPMFSNTWDYIPSGSTSNIIFCSIPLGKGIF